MMMMRFNERFILDFNNSQLYIIKYTRTNLIEKNEPATSSSASKIAYEKIHPIIFKIVDIQ